MAGIAAMITLAWLVLLPAAALCLGLSHLVSTRLLSFGAALATTVAAASLCWLNWSGSARVLVFSWLRLEPIHIVLIDGPLNPLDLTCAVVLLLGGALALGQIGLALAWSVRGFGHLVAWALLTLAAALLVLPAQGVLLAFCWGLVIVCGSLMVRASGVLHQQESMPGGIGLGLAASLVLLAGLLLLEPARLEQFTSPALGITLVVLAVLTLLGIGPWQPALAEAVMAPAALGGLFYGLALPLIALHTLLQVFTPVTISTLPRAWQLVLILLALGCILFGVISALREQSVRRMLAWLMGSQAGLVILAAALAEPLATVAAFALLCNVMLTTLAGMLACANLERITGSDDYTQITPAVRLRWTGLVWAAAALSALGLPHGGVSGVVAGSLQPPGIPCRGYSPCSCWQASLWHWCTCCHWHASGVARIRQNPHERHPGARA
ncbi:MAG: hypothetical protein HC837_17650 [Chloroflexaceae bacterium]|nr:hypothetical protein [Chloroflexaceae bacterium]